MQRHLKVEPPFAGHFFIFFLCVWCALCPSHWKHQCIFSDICWTSLCGSQSAALIMCIALIMSFSASILDTWMLFFFVAVRLCTSFILLSYNSMSFIETVYLKCYMVTQPSPPLDPRQSSEDEGTCANLLRILQGCMLKSRKQNRNLQRTKVP